MASTKSASVVGMMDRSRNNASSVFKGVSFYLVDETKDEQVKNLLKLHGASREFYISDLVTHVIAENINFPEYEQAKDAKLAIVKAAWVDACMKCDTLLPSNPFSPEQDSLFYGLTICLSQVPQNDKNALWAMITYHGAVCQLNLNPKCTHLVTGKASGRKFEFAIQKPDRVKIVTPEWITDSIKAKSLLIEEEYYPTEEPPKTPESTKPREGTPSKKTPTPKLNDGLPSSLLTPVTPTVSQGSVVKVLSPNKPQPNSPVSEADEVERKQAAINNHPNQNEKADIKTKSVADSTSNLNGSESDSHDILKGCIFVLSDYMDKLPDETLKIWVEAIGKYGGEVDNSYSKRCTHLLCLHQQGDIYKKALSDGKKIATAHWLNEVLMKKEFMRPCQPLHFPVPFSTSVSGCKDLLITISGYTGTERFIVKNMVSILGANYTGYFTQAHTHLICKTPEGKKYEKALEWGIPIVNARWLGDMLQAGQAFPYTGSPRYTRLGEPDELMLNEEYAKELLAAWNQPQEKMETSPVDENSKSKKRKPSEPSENPAKQAPEPAAKQRKIEPPVDEKPKACVLFTGLTGPAVNTYAQMLRKMKGEIAKGVKNCTHLIAPKITRTVKFLSAISVVHHIVTPLWIEDSNKAGTLLDETAYLLKDPESEECFGFKLDVSMQRSRTRKVFQGLKFFVTPNITPSPVPMKEIIECAGGEMFELKDGDASLVQFLDSKIKKKENSYVVTCEEDRSLWEPLHKEGHEVYNVELVLSGVMKQELEWDSHRF